jgi:DNA-binding MarR family transcriptional regulator
MTEQEQYDHTPLPALMLHARGSYGNAAREALAAIGCEDMPKQGGFVVAGLDAGAPQTRPQSEAVAFLGISKQASSQLIDTLVMRGYLEREVDPEDRRRMTVKLTERGCAAADAIQRAVDEIDAELAKRISPAQLQGLRAGLGALADIREAKATTAAG